jgi:hypothetical protein
MFLQITVQLELGQDRPVHASLTEDLPLLHNTLVEHMILQEEVPTLREDPGHNLTERGRH